MVTLKDPNIAMLSEGGRGHWTMVYDEGFEVTVNGLNFFAFSNFTFEQDPTTHSKHNVSNCGDTMVGWYQNLERTKYGCYYGSKVLAGPPVHNAALVRAKAAVPAEKKPMLTSYSKPLDHKEQTKVVAKLNKKIAMLQLGWTASSNQKWNGRSMHEINSYAGIRRSVKARELHRDMLRQKDTGSTRAKSFLQQGPSHPAAEMPKDFDWAAVNGKNYLEPVMDQADCGSCYVTAAMRMLTARHKIRQDDVTVAPWSINFPLMCSEYNQGCKGGYGLLTARWSRDVGLLPANCMKYDTAGQCKLECDLAKMGGKRYRADNHRYVGSWYGNSSAESIQRELFHNGPVSLGIEPAEDFMFYSDGIYKSTTNVNLLHRTDQEWERVDHAVVLVGWGEENGQKYWKIQNSWGPDWGEDGFFRIARGENESGIESIAEAADVVEDEQEGKQVANFFAQSAHVKSNLQGK